MTVRLLPLCLGLGLLGCSHGLTPPDPSPDDSASGEGAAAHDHAAAAATRLPLLEPCEVPGSPETLLCGRLAVPENRSDPDSRTISLEIVVVPSTSDMPPPEAVFVFEGGPGGAATRRAVGSVYAGPVRARDIVLVDQRGTGRSNPLECDWDPEFVEGELREMYPVDDVVACAEEIAAQTDTRLYTSARFADDVEEVRTTLGYEQLHLRGGSYGTAAMTVYAQRHPDSVASMFGIGWAARDNLAERGVWTDRVLGRLEELCAASPPCHGVTPDLDAWTRELLESLDAGPRRVTMPDPQDPERTLTVDVGRQWLTEQLRLVLYFTTTSRALPWAVHRAKVADDWRPLTTLAVLIERTFRGALATGLALTVQCSEMMEFDVEEARRRGARTLVGNYRLEQQLQGCRHWPHERVPPLGVDEPRPLPIPTLMLSGALDPVTPPEYATEAAELFPNSRHVILDEGQHGPFDLADSWECVHGMWAELIESGDPRAIDTSCADAMTRPPFVTDAGAFDSYLEDVLLPFVG